MAFSRKQFLKQTFKTIFVIGAGNSLQAFSASDFDLPSKDDVRLRFAIASDGHYGQPGTQFEQFHHEMVDWINKEQQDRKLDFAFINGDIIHDNPEFLPQAKTVFDHLKMPYYVSHGNHDKTTPEHWEKLFKYPWHHTFEAGGAAFLVLNTAEESGKYICPDIEWTKNQLKRYKTKKELFVFMHITPFKWTPNGIPCPELVELFDKQTNLKAIFHGHDHDQDGFKVNNGKYYFFDSHIAGNWGTNYRGYRVVEILKNGEILTYQVNPSIAEKVNSNQIPA